MTPRHRLKTRPRIRIAAAVVLAAGTVSTVLATSSNAGVAATINPKVAITMSDGVQLIAETVMPTTTGLHPLLVMPASWGASQLEYQSLAADLGGVGYDVIAFSARGMNQSQGVSDYADPASVADVSTIISWGIAHLNADPKHIGAMGVSYGAGLSLLAAEHDPRIKAVAALSTWSDWDQTFLPNGSVADELISTLAISAGGTAPTVRPGPQMTALFNDYASNPAAAQQQITSMAASRSPIAGVAALNANHTAVLLANGMQDSLLPPLQLVTLFGQLTGPKRLELHTGDHAMPEAPALYGGSFAGPVGDAFSWLDHYLLGVANGAGTAPPVQLTDTITGVTTGYPGWPAGHAAQSGPLGAPEAAAATTWNPAIDQPSADVWSRVVPWGLNTYAETGYEQGDVLDPYRITSVATSKWTNYWSFIWDGTPLTSPEALAGSPSLTLTVSANQPSVTMVAYLYDVGTNGAAQLMTATPMTLTGLTPGAATNVTWQFQPVAWTVPAGHHLTVIVDSGDHRWSGSNVAKTAVSIVSTATQPAQLNLPSS